MKERRLDRLKLNIEYRIKSISKKLNIYYLALPYLSKQEMYRPDEYNIAIKLPNRILVCICINKNSSAN